MLFVVSAVVCLLAAVAIAAAAYVLLMLLSHKKFSLVYGWPNYLSSSWVCHTVFA